MGRTTYVRSRASHLKSVTLNNFDSAIQAAVVRVPNIESDGDSPRFQAPKQVASNLFVVAITSLDLARGGEHVFHPERWQSKTAGQLQDGD
jgi:hypothetical protein